MTSRTHTPEDVQKIMEPWSPVSIGVDITEQGAHVVGIYALDKDTSQVFYSKFYPVPQPEQEPVAWVSSEELLVMRGNALGGAKDWRINVGLVKQDGDVGLYTTPPQRKPLTDEEIEDLYFDKFSMGELKAFARAIEAKLKEKNT